MPKPKDILLPAVRPNPTTEARFRKRLKALIEEMHRSVAYWIIAQYRETPPEIAQDATPASELQKAMKELSTRWLKRFDDAALELAEYYTKSISKRSDAQLKAILKKSGFAVKFRMTKAQRDIIDATVNESVSLIKSIPQKYLGDVEGAVMRSVQTGRDIGKLSATLNKTYGVTKKRATTIERRAR